MEKDSNQNVTAITDVRGIDVGLLFLYLSILIVLLAIVVVLLVGLFLFFNMEDGTAHGPRTS